MLNSSVVGSGGCSCSLSLLFFFYFIFFWSGGGSKTVRMGGGVRMERFKQISWKWLNANSITWEGLQRAESWPEPELQRQPAEVFSFHWLKFRLVVKTALTERKTLERWEHLGFENKSRPRSYISKNIYSKAENIDQDSFLKSPLRIS